MENEKEKPNNPLDWAKSIAHNLQKLVRKAKVTRSMDRRPKIPAGVPTPPNFNHPRIIKKHGGTVK